MNHPKPVNGIVLSLVAGLALWLSFYSDLLFPLAWVALVPFLAFLWSRPGWWLLLAGHSLMAFVYLGGTLYWIPRVLRDYGGLSWAMTTLAFVLMLLLLALSLLPFSLSIRWLLARSEKLALVCAPGVWLLTEVIRNYWLVNGFPWALLGYSQYPYQWITQVADIGGVYLVSFLVIFFNTFLWAALRRRSLTPLLVALIPFLVANFYGIYRVYWWQPQSGEAVRVSLVQPNLLLFQGREYHARQYFKVLPLHYQRSVSEGVDWVIFPEAPNPYYYGDDFYFTSFWHRQTTAAGVPLLLNSTTRGEGERETFYNSAVLLEGEIPYLYSKTHLVPFGEYIPLSNLLGTLFSPLVEEVSAFTPGSTWPVGRVAGTYFGTLICYEGIFPELARHLVNEGAELLVNITNDTWYGRSAAAAQHLRISTFRAIETRKPMLRVANSGYSAVVDYRGRIRRQLGLFQEGRLVEEVAGNEYRSIYSRTGDWTNMLIVGSTGLMAWLMIPDRKTPIGRRGKKKRIRR